MTETSSALLAALHRSLLSLTEEPPRRESQASPPKKQKAASQSTEGQSTEGQSTEGHPAATQPTATQPDGARVAVAVSGGVDSMTLAVVTHRALGEACEIFHAVSPAVPSDASARVRSYAAAEGWRLQVLNAGEFDDDRYLTNPLNRCFFCKSHLYEALVLQTDAVLLSGTNLDDLGDFRPGLEAARNHSVRHPFVEAGIDKNGIRRIARHLGLEGLAELPAAPCLSSRVETGLYIEATTLTAIDAAEKLVAEALQGNRARLPLGHLSTAQSSTADHSTADHSTVQGSLSPTGGPEQSVRCRLRRGSIVIELDAGSLGRLGSDQKRGLAGKIAATFRAAAVEHPVHFELYRRGSAFLRPQHHD